MGVWYEMKPHFYLVDSLSSLARHILDCLFHVIPSPNNHSKIIAYHNIAQTVLPFTGRLEIIFLNCTNSKIFKIDGFVLSMTALGGIVAKQ